MDVLDVGCGNSKTPGALGIDFNEGAEADLVHDLNGYPWPLESDRFDRIVCNHIIEHVFDPVRFMEEIHRVGRSGAMVELVTPHFSSRFSYTDPTHLRHLSLFSFDYFCEQSSSRPSLLSRFLEAESPVADFYSKARFKKVRVHLRFARPHRITGVQWFSNRFPHIYEAYMAFIFPARDLYVTLAVNK